MSLLRSIAAILLFEAMQQPRRPLAMLLCSLRNVRLNARPEYMLHVVQLVGICCARGPVRDVHVQVHHRHRRRTTQHAQGADRTTTTHNGIMIHWYTQAAWSSHLRTLAFCTPVALQRHVQPAGNWGYTPISAPQSRRTVGTALFAAYLPQCVRIMDVCIMRT